MLNFLELKWQEWLKVIEILDVLESKNTYLLIYHNLLKKFTFF